MSRFGKNPGIKGIAFLITIMLCLNAETDRMVEVECRVPMEFVGVPDSLVRMGEAPEEASVKVIFNRKFWQLRPGNLLASIDLSTARRGTHRFAVLPQDVALPHDRKARVVEIVKPKRVALTFEKKERKRIKVFPQFDGVPAENYVVFGEPKVEPDRVVLIGARSVVENMEAVHTDPVSLSGVTDDVRVNQAIDLSGMADVSTDPMVVEVFFDIEPIENRVLSGCPIRTSPRYGVQLEPDSLELTVRGPAAMLTEIPESRIRLSLNVVSLPPGEYSYLAEVTAGNRIRYFPTAKAEEDSTAVPLPDLEGSVQNLPDRVVLVDFAPKVFRIVRGGD